MEIYIWIDVGAMSIISQSVLALLQALTYERASDICIYKIFYSPRYAYTMTTEVDMETDNGNTYGKLLKGLSQQQVTQNFVAIFGQFVLLLLATVVLEAEDDWVVRRDERSVSDGVDDVFEKDIGAHGFAMRNYRFLVLSLAIPAV